MKCPICGNKLEIKNKQIGTDNSGDPVFNEYAVCRDCKKQWNLDKQRAKKAAAKASLFWGSLCAGSKVTILSDTLYV